MSAKRYTEEFKIEAVKQVTERGHRLADVAARLGVTTHSMYAWMKRYGVRVVDGGLASAAEDHGRSTFGSRQSIQQP